MLCFHGCIVSFTESRYSFALIFPNICFLQFFHPLFMMLSDPWCEEDDTNIQLVTDYYRVTNSLYFGLMSLECCNNLQVNMWFCLSLCSFSKICATISSMGPMCLESWIPGQVCSTRPPSEESLNPTRNFLFTPFNILSLLYSF